jgi:hypothetical protein
MSSKSRRYEVLLPVRSNEGQDIPETLLAEAVNEIVRKFGAASTAANRRWMNGFKTRWKNRLKQLELWMVSPFRRP